MVKRFKDWKAPVIKHGEFTKWFWLVWHPENLVLGRETDIGAFTYINALYGVEIGDKVEIASHCSIYSISTIDGKTGKVVLGENCKIGSHSTIMPGVTIGRGAVVGAHSFINKDIPPGVIAFGVPAKVIRKKS